MWKFFILILSLSTFGCHSVATELVMDPNLSPRQMEAVVLAADYWCDMGEACLPVSVGENNGEGYVTSQSSCEPSAAGEMHRENMTIHLCDDRDHLLDRVVPHEIGHALGLNHVKRSGEVMSRYIEGQPVVIDLD